MQGMAKPSLNTLPFPIQGASKPRPRPMPMPGRPAGPKPPMPPTPGSSKPRPMPMPMPGVGSAMPKPSMPAKPSPIGPIGLSDQKREGGGSAAADNKLAVMDSLKRAFTKGKSKPRAMGGMQ
jgi:hypothetical protein